MPIACSLSSNRFPRPAFAVTPWPDDLSEGGAGGRISDVIAALAYAVANKDLFNIRIINLSIAAGVYESYNDDPLTLAARVAVGAGIVVVAAAGNNGRGPEGRTQYGGTGAPGNAPWVSSALDASAFKHERNQNGGTRRFVRSEEHTSELQSLRHLVCRLLLEKK